MKKAPASEVRKAGALMQTYVRDALHAGPGDHALDAAPRTDAKGPEAEGFLLGVVHGLCAVHAVAPGNFRYEKWQDT